MKLIATTLQGLEEVLSKEVQSIGGSGIKVLKRAVLFNGSRYTLYAANLYLRTAIRVLSPILETRVRDEHELYDKVKSIEWEKIFTTSQTFAVYAVTSSNIFRHSKYTALKSKDAIADRFRDKHNRRPSVDTKNPDIVINIHIRQDRLTVSLDSSGDSLHMRGYRRMSVEAPISENLAAGLLTLLQWNPDYPIYDPMCGSGTFLAEAFFLGKNISPQNPDRDYAFKNWKDYSEVLHQRVIDEFSKKQRNTPLEIIGSDLDPKAVDVAEFNLKSISGNEIKIQTKDFFNSEKPSKKGWMIINPPYDERLSLDDAIAFYDELGTTLKDGYSGWTIGIVSSNERAMKGIGLRPTKTFALKNGSIDVYFSIFDIYG